MSDTFDPYRHWLSISDPERPLNHYRLLGLHLFEEDAEKIWSAAVRRMGQVLEYDPGPHCHDARRLFDELEEARLCLSDTQRRLAYDEVLRRKIEEQVEAIVARNVVSPTVLADETSIPAGPAIVADDETTIKPIAHAKVPREHGHTGLPSDAPPIVSHSPLADAVQHRDHAAADPRSDRIRGSVRAHGHLERSPVTRHLHEGSTARHQHDPSAVRQAPQKNRARMADRRVLLVALTGIAASALIVLGYGWVTREPPEVDPVPPLIAQLKSSNPQVREAAADKLRQLGPRSGEAVPQLLLVLRDDQNQDVRFAAAQALANSGPAVMTAESELNRLMIFETNPGVRQALKGLLEGKP